jgi:hypothetical protein
VEIDNREVRRILKVFNRNNLIVRQSNGVQLGRLRHSRESLESILMQVEHNKVVKLHQAIVLHSLDLVLGNT